ncbi:hypothetical protein EV137_2549 [Kribbella pratensis]|uniref:Bacterial Ig domain-containing protein n=1 Tax=Kribbella pratensis TaxID=2512112 RepID=A0ABY2FRN3_9ACTN|nr:hypothetical protein [Kribbella pratensis]TDW95215.1 hypothetical protein EV137_2549 [Kribbella pratensis]
MRAQFIRRSAAVVAGLALAAGGLGIAGALQANAAGTSNTAVSTTAVARSITIKAAGTYVPLWAKVPLTGKTTGIAKGTVVQVQRLQSGKWVNFPATTKVTSKGTYSVWVASGRAGVNKFRVVAAKTASPSVSITYVK